MDYCEIIAYLWELSKDKGLAESIRQKLRDSTFISFSMLFYFLTTCKVISYSEKVNVLNVLKKDIPNLSFKNGLKQRIVNILYHKIPYTYLTLRIFYADYLQHICWAIGDFIRNKKNTIKLS